MRIIADCEKNQRYAKALVNDIFFSIPFDFTKIVNIFYMSGSAPKHLLVDNQPIAWNKVCVGRFAQETLELWVLPTQTYSKTRFNALHEIGHAVAMDWYGQCEPDMFSKYKYAIDECQHPMEYGRTSPAEDFAETFALWVMNRNIPEQRYKVMTSILKGMAKRYPKKQRIYST